MEVQKSFGPQEHETWAKVMRIQRPLRSNQLVPIFQEGLELLGMDIDSIPNVEKVNQKLKALTGWTAVLGKGLIEKDTFFQMLANREFPVGNFIRDSQDLNYTPEPDIVHDLYGHIPFFANKAYARANEIIGKTALKPISKADRELAPKSTAQWKHQEDKLTAYERFYWFTFEFALTKTPIGKRIFGAGIASSVGECKYALSPEPHVIPFDLDVVMQTEYRIDVMQTKLFLLESPDQLYRTIDLLST